MKILIIGSSGFIGSHCVSYFSKAHIVVCQERTSDFASIFASQNFDICINASGSANVGFSFESPEIDFELNVLNINKLLSAIRKYNPNCKFINFSSASVYGNPQLLPVNEYAEIKPLSPYGFHKLQSELLLREYFNFFGVRSVSLRVFSAYGPNLRKQLFWDLYQKTLKSNHIELFGTGNESRDFIYIDDLMDCIEVVINEAKFEGECINVGSGNESILKNIVPVFLNSINPSLKFFFNNKVKEGDPLNWKADIGVLTNYGFKIKTTIEIGLEKTVEWLKNQKI